MKDIYYFLIDIFLSIKKYYNAFYPKYLQKYYIYLKHYIYNLEKF